jgi:hypothetical protein
MSWLDRLARRAASPTPTSLSPEGDGSAPDRSRRDFMRKAAMGGALVWSVPVIQTVLAPSASASGLPGLGEACPNNVCASGFFCSSVTGTCGGSGATCGGNAGCVNGNCFNGVCGGSGATCSSNAGCAYGNCNGTTCGGLNATCSANSQCAAVGQAAINCSASGVCGGGGGTQGGAVCTTNAVCVGGDCHSYGANGMHCK